MDELLAYKGGELELDLVGAQVRDELVDRVLREALPDDRGGLEHLPLVAVELVEPGGEERVDRRRHREVREVAVHHPAPVHAPQETVLDQHREELLGEERVPLGRIDDPPARLLGEIGAPEDVLEHEPDVCFRERCQRDSGLLRPLRPARAQLEHCGAGRADDQERGVGDGVHQVLDQVEERRLRPVDVLEHDDERALARERLEQHPHRPEELVDKVVLLREPECGREALEHRLVVADDPGELLERRRGVVVDDARGLSHRLRERPERDSPPVGEAAAAEDVRLALDRAGELGHEARLADARVGEQRHEPAGAISPRPPELALEERQLALAPDQGEGELAVLPLGPDRHQPVGRHALGLALELERLDRLDLDRIADEAVRRLADQDLHLAPRPARAAPRR